MATNAEPAICRIMLCERKSLKAKHGLCESHRTQAWRYGIDKEDLIELFALKAGMCHLCERVPATAIDHDHSCCPRCIGAVKGCGECVRGVLCLHCNLALGHLHDDVDRLQKAIAYLSEKVLVAG